MELARRPRAATWLLTILVAATAAAGGLWIASAAASPSRPASAPHSPRALGSWSTRTINSSELWSASCPTSSFCLAAGQGPGLRYPKGYVYTYSRGKWSAGRRLDPHTYQDTVSCSSPAFCMMVDSLPQISPAGYQGGYAFTYSRGSWSRGRKITLELTSVSCSAGSFCAAVGLARGLAGDVYIYSAGRWSRRHELGPRQDPVGISCTSRSFCMAITTPVDNGPNGYAIYSDRTWTRLRALRTLDGDYLVSVSCASPRSCVATDDGGVAYIYAHGHWKTGQRIGTADESPAVSCLPSFFCVAVAHGWADQLSGGRWSSHAVIARKANLGVVSCAAGPFCVAVGVGARNPPGLAAWTRRPH
jgi:hypothetical protein